MDLPNFSKPGSVTEQAPQNTKKKLAIFGGVGVFMLAIVGAYFFLSTPSASNDGPPGLEVQSKGTQGMLKEQNIGFLLPEKADIDAFKERKNSFLKEITPTKLTLAKEGLQYVYVYNSGAKAASFKDVVENIDIEAAKILFAAKWDAKNIFFETTPHDYYVKEKEGKTVTKIASNNDEYKKVEIQPAGGAILAIAASTDIYGFNDGKTFAQTPYGICDASKANGWHLFASHTTDATLLFQDCAPGQVKEFHIQTGLDPVVFKPSAQDSQLTYSMVWVNKGDEVKGAAKEEDKTDADKKAELEVAEKAAKDAKAAADKAAADKATADKAAADAKAASDKAAADAKTATDKAAADKAAADAKAASDKAAADKAAADKAAADAKAAAADKAAADKAATDLMSGITTLTGILNNGTYTNLYIDPNAKTKTYDVEFTLSGTTLTVQWADGTKNTYTITLPKGGYTVEKNASLNMITIKDPNSEIRSNIIPNDGELENIFTKTDESELKVTIGTNQITIISTATSHSDIVQVFQNGGLIWEKVNWGDTKWGKNSTYKASCNNSPNVNKEGHETFEVWHESMDDDECIDGKDSHIVEQHAKTGDMNFAYKIYLSEEAKSKLAAADDEHFYFKTAYKRHWEETNSDIGVLHKSDIINFEVKPGGKLDLSNDSDSAVKNNVVYESDGAIYVRVFVPWPGLELSSDYSSNANGGADWGKTEVHMYFFEVANNADKLFGTKTLYKIEQFAKPNLYLNIFEGGMLKGCPGHNHEIQMRNSGGFLPKNAYDQIYIYSGGGAIDRTSIESYFDYGKDVMPADGSSDKECETLGKTVYLLKGNHQTDNTIWSKSGY